VGDDKAKMDGAWRGYNTRVSKLEEYRGRTCSLILGQCTTVLKDKLKHDADYKAVIDSGKPLQYKSLIEKTIMAQADDQYNCAAVHDQMCHLLGFSQGALSNDQYYERFNTRVDVSKSVGVSWVQDGITKPLSKVLYKKELHQITPQELKEVREQAAERFLTYVFIKNSSSAHAKLKEDLKNDFAKGHDNYPENRQEGLRLLDMFTQQDTRKPTIVSEGSSFGTVSEEKSSNDYDVEYWANKTCYCCGKKGHPSWKHTPEEIRKSKKAQQEKNKKKESKESDNESVGSTKSKKSAAKKKANLESAAKTFASVMVENMAPLLEGYDSDELSH
jgi:Rod binding domain-containing protein